MPHDVFISYSNKNKVVADAVCAKLEENKIRVWIAPRDVPPGKDFAAAIIHAIDHCPIFVLIWSEESNKSEHILNEVNRAFSQNITVIPFRIDNVVPTESLEYYIGRTHWLDAMTPPLEKHIKLLADTILTNLGRQAEIKLETPDVKEKEVREEKKKEKEEDIKLASKPSPKPRTWWPYLMGLLGVAVVVGLALTLLKQPAQPTSNLLTNTPAVMETSSQPTNIPIETATAIPSSTPINLTKNKADDEYPAWSPDGQKIAFDSDSSGNSEIYMMNADGSNPINLTKNKAIDNRPAWSADGKKIAFFSDRDGNYEVYVMNADGSNPINLTNNKANDYRPAWSADGQKIVFMSNRDGNYEIYVMSADGSNPINLTKNKEDDFDPAWSADGQKIAFMSTRDGNFDIYVMNADGSNQINLTNNPANDEFPAWSTDGQKIVFMSNRDGNYEIYVMNTDGSNPINLTNNPVDDVGPAWSPDGQKIAFASDRDGNYDIYVMNAPTMETSSQPTNIPIELRKIVSYDFSNTETWPSGKGDTGSYGYEDGGYFIEMTKQYNQPIFVEGYESRNLIIKVKTKVVSSNSSGSYGLLCRVVDGNNYYQLGISNSAQYAIFALKDNQWQALIEGSYSKDLENIQSAELEIACIDNQFSISVNGKMIGWAQDPELTDPHGTFGMFVQLDSLDSMESFKVIFDDLEIYQQQ